MKLTAHDLTKIALFSSLICLASLILKFGGDAVVPFSILPFMVMLTGAILGPRLGTYSVAVYILIGLVGVPVYAKPPYGGISYLVQPTFGFVLGYIAEAYVIGKLLQDAGASSVWRYVGAMAAGTVMLYLLGVPYLYAMVRFYLGKPFTFWSAVQVGFLPFFGLDLLKALPAAFIARSVRVRLTKQGA